MSTRTSSPGAKASPASSVDTRNGKITRTGAMHIDVEVHTLDRKFRFDMLDRSAALDTVDTGDEIDIHEKITVEYSGTTLRNGIESPDISKFTFSIRGGLAAEEITSVATQWLFERLSTRRGLVRRVVIDGKETALDEHHIEQAFEEAVMFGNE